MFVAVLIVAAVVIPPVVACVVLPLAAGIPSGPQADIAAGGARRIAANARAVAAGDWNAIELSTAIRGYDPAAIDAVVATLWEQDPPVSSADAIGPVDMVRGGYRMDETDALIDCLIAHARRDIPAGGQENTSASGEKRLSF
ncbi:hypothetical protein ACFSSC_07340 [Corynebacterium mendelii]|uniref:Uncharacterized protein n=1 Tax=Corynebacterium mendelii TaxID=2765362 RepID=A0A939IXV0_9CORY|nr:hypothetical protein [Corynebacterium mendelii]MBN9644855.1 hypothetical protein [Corynebacterium mendelii]